MLDIDFIKYSGTYGGNMQGTVDASFVKAKLNVKSEGSSKLQLSFGSLKKEEVDVPKLMRESKGRLAPLTESTLIDLNVPLKKYKQKNVFSPQPSSLWGID